MQQTTLNDTLQLSFNEGFHIMEQPELTQYILNPSLNTFGIADNQRHIAVTVVWSKPNALFRLLLTPRFALRGMETVLRRTTQKYKRLEYMKTNIGGAKALGFNYLYNAGDLERAGIAIVFKYKGCFYQIYYYARRKDGYSTHKVFAGILSSMKLTNPS